MATAEQNKRWLGTSPPNEESAKLLAPLYRLRNRLVSRVIFRELINVFLTLLVIGLATMLLDAAFRWRSHLPRWIGSVLIFSAVLTVAGRALARRSWTFDLAALSERLEEIFPSLSGKLRGAVSIALAPGDDPLTGSRQLQKRLLNGAAHSLAQVDVARALASSTPRLRMNLTAFCLLAIAIWASASPKTAWQAARRLVTPWRLDPWPRLVVLELSAPRKVARGGEAAIVVQSKTSQVPSQATIYVVDDQGDIVSRPMQRQGRRFVFTVAKVNAPLWLRAVGGDDDQMRWSRLDVVEPITLTATRLEASPPAYANLPSVRVGKEMSVLEGTKLLMEYRASRRMKKATPRWLGRTRPPLKTDSSGRIAKGEWTIADHAGDGAAPFQIDVLDQEGAMALGAWKGSIKVLRDLPPTIQWIEPKSAGKALPQSQWPLSAAITDDIRLESMELRRRIVKSDGNAQAWQNVVIPPLQTGLKETNLAHEEALGELQVAPGDAVEWLLVVTDAKGQIKESEIVRCFVVEVDELRKEFDRRLEQILTQLLDAKRRQEEIASAIVSSESQDESRAARLATARAAQFDQRSLLQLISNPSGGVLEAWKRWAQDQKSHQFAGKSDQELLDMVTQDLALLAAQDLPAVVNEFDHLDDLSQSPTNVDIHLSTAATLAQSASERLSLIVDRLTNWRKWSHASQTVEEILTAEQKLQSQTRELAAMFTGKLPEELAEQDRQTLHDLAEKQASLAKQLADLPHPRDSKNDSWRGTQDKANAHMVQAARDLRLNQLHQADTHQTQAVDAIQQLSQEASLGNQASSQRTNAAQNQSAADPQPPNGPTEAQLKNAIELQRSLKAQTLQTLAELEKPGANEDALQKELAELAKAQAALAAQVDSWLSKPEETPRD